jgi:hypothetical protein
MTSPTGQDPGEFDAGFNESAVDAPQIGAPRPDTVPAWWTVVALLGIAVVAAASYLFFFRSSDATHSVTVTFLLRAGLNAQVGQPCSGTGGYADIVAGANVTARNGDGKIIATEPLGPGRAQPGQTGSDCLFEVTLKNLPETDFYSFEVSRRGQLNYSLDQLQAQGWAVDFVLGP